MEQKRTGLSYVFTLARGERGKLGVGMLLAVLCSALSLIPYLVVYQILLLIIQNEVTFGAMAMWACIGIAAAIGQAILMSFAGICSHVAAFNTMHKIKVKVLEHISRFNLGFFQERSPGQIKTTLFDDVDRVEQFLAHSTLELAQAIVVPLSWVVPCASTWGVVGLISGTFFGGKAVFVILSLFAVAFLHIYITYKIFGRSLNKENDRTGLIMELPPYHKPHWKTLLGSVFNKMGSVLKRALSIIICISVIFWLLSYTPDGNVTNSIIYRIGTFIEPVTMFFGLPWQLFMAFVASAMGKESALGVMASLFNTAGIWGAIEGTSAVDTAALSTNLLSTISQPEALAFLFAFFFNMPCLMALAATAQETHSMKWTVRIALYYILSALIL